MTFKLRIHCQMFLAKKIILIFSEDFQGRSMKEISITFTLDIIINTFHGKKNEKLIFKPSNLKLRSVVIYNFQNFFGITLERKSDREWVCECVCVREWKRVCVFVCKRERERERERKGWMWGRIDVMLKKFNKDIIIKLFYIATAMHGNIENASWTFTKVRKFFLEHSNYFYCITKIDFSINDKVFVLCRCFAETQIKLF